MSVQFEKSSLRTRSTFEIAIRELGGDFIDPSADVALGARESLADVGRSLERWVEGAVVRTFDQARIVDLAMATRELRVINALSNDEHPARRWPTASRCRSAGARKLVDTIREAMRPPHVELLPFDTGAAERSSRCIAPTSSSPTPNA